MLGGLLASGGGWVAQIHLAKIEERRREIAGCKGIKSELTVIASIMTANLKGNNQPFFAANLNRHINRYSQISNNLSILPDELLVKIDALYARIINIISAGEFLKKLIKTKIFLH